MLKFLLSKFRRQLDANRAIFAEEACLHWFRDPLSHPALEAMNERELGDLPFRR